MLLVDEIDRADDEFEAFLLEVLADNAGDDPRAGHDSAEVPPAGRADVQPHAGSARRAQAPLPLPLGRHIRASIGRWRFFVAGLPDITERLARDVAAATKRLRDADLLKPPGVAESIDWAQALHLLGARSLDPEPGCGHAGRQC